MFTMYPVRVRNRKTQNLSFIKLYNSKIDVAPMPGGLQKNDFHGATRHLMIFAQCFGLFPIQGLRSESPENIRFEWLSVQVLYSTLILLGLVSINGFVVAYYSKGFLDFSNTVLLSFYGSGLVCCILYIRLAAKWRDIIEAWHEVEIIQEGIGHPQNLHQNIRKYILIMMPLALVEHCLCWANQITIEAHCSRSISEIIKRTSMATHRYMFEFIEYSLVIGILSEVINFVATFYWNFNDLFIIAISIALSSRFKFLNEYILEKIDKVNSQEFWRKIRVQYNALSNLTKYVDSCVSRVVLLSVGTNLFFITQQLYNSMVQKRGLMESVYLYYSSGYLLYRAVAVSLFAASIYEESQATRFTLYSVPPEYYRVEVHRLLFQITTDKVALTGFNFFTITRTLLLTLGGTMVTYVVIMVQFSGSTNKTSNHTDSACMSFGGRQ